MMSNFVLRATLGPPNKMVNFLYSESPVQRDHIVRVNRIESAQRLMKVSYMLIEDIHGAIDKSKMPLTPKEAANFLGIAQSTVYKYIRNCEDASDGPRLEARKSGDTWKISRADAELLKSELEG